MVKDFFSDTTQIINTHIMCSLLRQHLKYRTRKSLCIIRKLFIFMYNFLSSSKNKLLNLYKKK